jgi:hypothetical protein
VTPLHNEGENMGMKIKTTLVGIVDHTRTLDWPDGWPMPREGESVDVNGLGGLSVRTVVWFPEGDDDDPEPFVYLVIGQPRR